MTQFVPNKPVQTRKPFVTVDAGLEPGRYRFQLEVMDSAGNLSKPAVLTVSVQPARGGATGARRSPAGRRGTRPPR